MKPAVIAVVLLVVWPLVFSHAEMYKWEDENGVVTFKDTPPPVSKKRKVKVYKDSDFAADPPAPVPGKKSRSSSSAAAQSTPAPPRPAAFTGTIEMYATEWCGYCQAAESYMKSKNYPYVKYDIEKDAAAKQRHKDLGGRGVPLIIVGNNKMSGFSPGTLEYYLAKP